MEKRGSKSIFALSLKNTTSVKGILCLLVICRHLESNWPFYDNSQVARFVFGAFGYLAVAGFFFLSGYGLFTKYKQAGTRYRKSFFHKKIIPYYLEYICVVLLYAVALFFSHLLSMHDLIQSFFFGNTIVINGWYLQATLLLYILFYLSMLFGGDKIHYTLILTEASVFLYITICKTLGLPEMWFRSVICFGIGTAYSFVEDYMGGQKISQSVMDIVGYGATVFFTILLSYQYRFGAVPLSIVCVHFVFILCFLLTRIKEIPRVFYCVGKISFEVYMLHGLIIAMLRSGIIYIKSDALYLFMVFSFTLLAAYGLNYLFGQFKEAYFTSCERKE